VTGEAGPGVGVLLIGYGRVGLQTSQEQNMSEQHRSAPATDNRLRANCVGTVGITLMVIAAMAPLTTLTSNLSLSLAFGTGIGTVGVILVVTLILLVFTSGYLVMTRHVVNAGAYYAFIRFGLGNTAGCASAVIATIAYNAAAAGMAAAVGYFTDLAVTTYLHVDLPWILYTVAALLATVLLGFFGVSIAARATSIVSFAQFAILLALSVAVLIRNPGGFTLDVFSPHNISGGQLGFTIVFVLLSFAGYEASAIYAEEARGRRTVVRATYAVLIILTIAFTFSTWALVAAVDDIVASAQADPGGVVTAIASTYLGGWSAPLLLVTVAFSFLAACVAFHNMSVRYIYSLGRSGLLPAGLARVHPRTQTPHIAGATQTALSLAVVTPFAVAGADPLVNLFPAISGITSLSVIYLMAAVCVSVLVAALRNKVQGSRWATRVSPAIAGLALIACGVLIVWNYSAVTGSDAWIINLMPLVLVVGAVYGAVASRGSAFRESEPADSGVKEAVPAEK
jgi:amino acid transporter